MEERAGLGEDVEKAVGERTENPPNEESGSIHPLDESLRERIISLGFSLFIYKGEC